MEMRRTPGLLLSIAVLSGRSLAASPPPDRVVAFSRNLPLFFEKLGEMVATEKITQTLISEKTAAVARRRILESDFEISHLAEDPTALWEFRFVSSIPRKRARRTSEGLTKPTSRCEPRPATTEQRVDPRVPIVRMRSVAAIPAVTKLRARFNRDPSSLRFSG